MLCPGSQGTLCRCFSYWANWNSTSNTLHMRYNWCKFGCKWSIRKVTLREEWSTFSTVSLLFHGSFWNTTAITHCASSAIGTSLVVISQQWRVLYLKNKVFLHCTLPSITWIFLKLHTYQSLRVVPWATIPQHPNVNILTLHACEEGIAKESRNAWDG